MILKVTDQHLKVRLRRLKVAVRLVGLVCGLGARRWGINDSGHLPPSLGQPAAPPQTHLGGLAAPDG